MATALNRLSIPRLYFVSGSMVVSGLMSALIGVLFWMDGMGWWWVLLAIGATNVFTGAAIQYENDPDEYSIHGGMIAVAVGATVVELAVFGYIAFLWT